MAAAGSSDTATAPQAPSTPSAEWAAGGRPQLSPEHVALLTWWAQMIASGQLPAPPGSGDPEGARAEAEAPRRRFPKRAAAIAILLVAVAAVAAVFVPRLLSSAEHATVPATDITLPAAIGELTAITEPGVADTLEPILGFPLRPSGVTVTAAYGPGATGPVTFAAAATSVAAAADPQEMITSWAQRTGATVADPVSGEGATLGVTCAAATGASSLPDGVYCVWTSITARGETFGIGMTTDEAATLTAQLRGETESAAVA